MFIQNLSYTVVAPLWLLLHLLTSPVSKPFPGTHANSVLLISPWDLRILPASVTIGYIIPSLLMALPVTRVPPASHQHYIAMWQAFPLWCVFTHHVLLAICSRTSRYLSRKDTQAPTAPQGASYLSNAKHIYRSVLALCISTHLPVVLLALTPSHWILPSFPTLTHLATASPLAVYVPYFPTPSTRVAAFATGVHTFLIWDLYLGSAAFLLWAALLYRNATTEKAIVDPNTSLPLYRELLAGERKGNGGLWRKLGVKVALWAVAGGPVGALTILLWERDAIVRQKIKQGM